MKRRYIYDKKGRAVEVSESGSRNTSYQVMPDIKPYRSMVDGTLITSRSRHREHLKAHGCVEVGNDSSLHHEPRPLRSPPGLKEAIIRASDKLKRI